MVSVPGRKSTSATAKPAVRSAFQQAGRRRHLRLCMSAETGPQRKGLSQINLLIGNTGVHHTTPTLEMPDVRSTTKPTRPAHQPSTKNGNDFIYSSWLWQRVGSL
ncbi:unnamed protein product [Ectocarpus sp. 13 AM-2016]